jgi:hypothetical protein
VTRVKPIFNVFISILLLCILFLPLSISGRITGDSKPAPPETTPFKHIAGAVHLQTPVSGGKRTIDDYLKLAREKDIGILIITDHDTQKYEYGIWPLRGLIKKTVESPSVFKYGCENYFALIRQANSSSNDVLIIDGVESMPFYYWSGGYFNKDLSLNDRGKHILVIGLNDAQGYKNLPLIGNGKSRFSQYEGSQSYTPYQDLIDYCNARGGCVFWSHPEAKESKSIRNIIVNTLPYPEALKATLNYTGFAIFEEGYQKIGIPNGIWDTVLKEYCENKRTNPVWAIGELDDYGNKDIDKVLTVFLLKHKTYQSAIDSLKNGKTYTLLKGHSASHLVLEEFYLYNPSASPASSGQVGGVAYSGEEFVTSSAPYLKIKISQKTPSRGTKATMKIIRQGMVIKEVNQTLPIEVKFKDNYQIKSGERIYYRLDVVDEKMNCLISNPIFVRFQQ